MEKEGEPSFHFINQAEIPAGTDAKCPGGFASFLLVAPCWAPAKPGSSSSWHPSLSLARCLAPQRTWEGSLIKPPGKGWNTLHLLHKMVSQGGSSATRRLASCWPDRKLGQRADLDLCVWHLGRGGGPTAQATVTQELRQFSLVKQVSSPSHQQTTNKQGHQGRGQGRTARGRWSSGLGPAVVSATETLAQDAAPATPVQVLGINSPHPCSLRISQKWGQHPPPPSGLASKGAAGK